MGDGAAGENALRPWLREEDLELGEEDQERNTEQAGRNAAMREALRRRRKQKDAETEPVVAEEPEDFMSVSAPAALRAKAAVEEGQPPWFVTRPHIENAVLRLHEELLDFMDFMKHTDDEVKARRSWVKTITSACRALWPNCKARIFGSFLTGLSLPNGDVDVAVFDVPCKQGTAMKMLADHMLATGDISWLEIIESAKVPVVKLRSQSCGLRADVVFNMTDGIETSKFVLERIKEYPQMKPLLVFLKYFLLQRGLHETYTGGMGSFLLSNVVLHFLQRHPSRRDPQNYKATSLGHLLFDLLKYYGQEFRYDQTAISVLNGGRTFSKTDRQSAGKGKGKGKKGVQLCLESPSDPSVDLGGPCFRMAVLKNLFHHGFHCLCHLFVSKAPPEASMLCPLLLDPVHPVITDRYKLMAEQPVALMGAARAGEREEAAAEEEPKAKRARTDEGVPLPTRPGEEDETGFVPLGADGEDGVADEYEDGEIAVEDAYGVVGEFDDGDAAFPAVYDGYDVDDADIEGVQDF